MTTFDITDNDGVSILRMDDGKVNAIGPEFVTALNEAWAKAADGERPVVITGNDRVFSAGLDLKALVAMDTDRRAVFGRAFMGAFGRVFAHDAPVVAAVNGAAIAGGAVAALCADARIVTDDATMGVPEVAVGVPFPEPALAVVRHRLPAQEITPAVLQGESRKGAACVEHGWAHEHAAPDDLLDRSVELATALASASRTAYRTTKRGLDGGVRAVFDAFNEQAARAWAELLEEPDAAEALERTVERLSKR